MTERGKKFIKISEGCLFTAKWDYKGYAIGYGNHTLCGGTAVPEGYKISTRAEADEIFECSLPGFESWLREYLTNFDSLNDDKKDALMSFIYNLGPDNFRDSTLRRLVDANPEGPEDAIINAFKSWNKVKKNGVLVPDQGLTLRRTREAEMYFGRNTGIPEVDNLREGGSGAIQTQQLYNPSYGVDNMFYELSHSKDWNVVKFKHLPKPSNNWRYLFLDKIRPKVGDLLFAYHDYKTEGVHNHVAIYLGIHGGTQYVAEGISVSGDKIQGKTGGVQIVPIDVSRIGLSSDSITHFAHCTKYSIKQTSESTSYVPFVRRSNTNSNNYTPVIGEGNMKYFTLYGNGSKGLGAPSDANKIEKRPELTYQEIQQNLIDLCNYVLDPLEDAVRKENLGTIHINQAYRTPSENDDNPNAVANSQHMYGQAADIRMEDANREHLLRLAQIILELESQTGFEYDQLILEGVDKGKMPNKTVPGWLHISFKKNNKGQSNREYSSGNKLGYTTDEGKIPGTNRIKLGKFTKVNPEDITQQTPNI